MTTPKSTAAHTCRLLLIVLLAFTAVSELGCATRGKIITRQRLDERVGCGRLFWYYRGSDADYHYLALVMGVPVPLFNERREYVRIRRPELDDLLLTHVMSFNPDGDVPDWKLLRSRPTPDHSFSSAGWEVVDTR